MTVNPRLRLFLRIMAVAIPALASAFGSYMKAKSEAANGYKVLADQVKKQGETIELLQRDNDEWRKQMIGVLLKMTPDTPVATPAPVAAPAAHDRHVIRLGGLVGSASFNAGSGGSGLQALSQRRSPVIHLKAPPSDFSMAQHAVGY